MRQNGAEPYIDHLQSIIKVLIRLIDQAVRFNPGHNKKCILRQLNVPVKIMYIHKSKLDRITRSRLAYNTDA